MSHRNPPHVPGPRGLSEHLNAIADHLTAAGNQWRAVAQWMFIDHNETTNWLTREFGQRDLDREAEHKEALRLISAERDARQAEIARLAAELVALRATLQAYHEAFADHIQLEREAGDGP